MNARPASPFPVRGLLCSALLLPAALAAAPASGKAAYTLFMGVDLQLEHERNFYRVDDVTGSYFKVKIDGRDEMIPTREGTARMRIDSALKLAGTPLEVDGLKTERTYTPATDPRRKFQKMAGAAMGAGAAADLATYQANQASANLGAVSSRPDATPGEITAAQSAYKEAAQGEYNAYYSFGSDINSAGYHEQELEIELAKEDFDAIEISMKLSSPVVLDDPFVLVIARIHERGEKPGVFRNWIFAQKLDPIGSKEQKVYIKQGGFPTGYSIEDTQVRIYNHGREVPTNDSPKRVDLTHEQAQQYVVIEHLAAHKEDTMAAMPVFGEAPADLKSRLASGEYSQPFYVKVDADGNATGTFSDRDCRSEVDDPYVTAFVATVLFAPALDKGKPVPGVAPVLFGKLLN